MPAAAAVPTVPVTSCPVCGGTTVAPLHGGLTDRVFGVAPGSWSLVGCAICGLGYLNPRPADEAITGLYASYYTHEPPRPNTAPVSRAARALRALRNAHVNARLGYELAPSWGAGRVAGRLMPPLAAIAERGVRHLPAGGRVLDVGCGNGLFVAEAAAAGWQASGIDLDTAAVEAGRSIGLDLAVEGIEQRAAREPAAFDAVTLSHVLEHVPDPVAFLASARDLLRPGGVVWIATPNLASEGHRRYGAAWVHLDPPRHFVLFEEHSLRRALQAAGFVATRILRPTPNATAAFAISEAVRAGVVPANAAAGSPARSTRAAGLRADLAAQQRTSRAEELLALATAPAVG